MIVCRATDLTLDPVKSTRPRYGAYIRARHRFWEAFPGGLFTRLPTPGTNLECGLHALRLSMLHQLAPPSAPSSSSSSSAATSPAGVAKDCTNTCIISDTETKTETEAGAGSNSIDHREPTGRPVPAPIPIRIPTPTVAELRAVYRQQGGDVARANVRAGLANDAWFTADQLAAVFRAWGRARGLRCQMGYVSGGGLDGAGGLDPAEAEDGGDGRGGGVPVMMNTPEVDTGEPAGEGIVRVWVWNDGASLAGGVGHFEGIRRPTEEELRRMEGEGGKEGRCRQEGE